VRAQARSCPMGCDSHQNAAHPGRGRIVMTHQLRFLRTAAELLLAALATSVPAAEKNPVDCFRDLLSALPTCVEVLWREEVAGSGWSMTPMFVSTNAQVIRWQTNAYLWGFGDTLEQFAGSRWAVRSIRSRYGKEVWWADPLSVHYGVYSNNLANDTFKHVAGAKSWWCLTLGVHLLEPGTARWTSEKTFEGECLSKDRNSGRRHAGQTRTADIVPETRLGRSVDS